MARAGTLTLFLVATLLFGGAFPAVAVGLSALPPLLFVAARNLLSAAVLLAFVLATGADSARWRPRSAADWTAIGAGGAFMIGGVGFGFVGQQFVASGIAAIIFSLSPVVTALFAWVLLPGERLGRREYVGVAVGFLGAAIVLGPDPADLFARALLGKLLILVGVTVVAFGTVLVRRSGHGLGVAALTGWAMLVAAVLQAAVGLAIGESPAAVTLTPAAVGSLLYLGVFAGAVGFVAYLTVLDRVGALRAALVTYLIPIVSIAVGWAALGERLQPVALVGFVVIAAGFALLEREYVAAGLARYRGAFR